MMKSKKIFIMALSIAIIGVISNGSVFAAPVEKSKIVDKRGGKKAKEPKWKTQKTSELEKEYSGKYVYRFEKKGKDIDYLVTWLEGVRAGQDVANFLSREIANIVVAATEGDGKQKEYSETLTTSVSKAKIVGLRKEDDWWELKQFTSGDRKGEREYTYYVLYIIDKKFIDQLLDNQMEKALNGANAQTKSRVKDAMDNMIKSGVLEEE